MGDSTRDEPGSMGHKDRAQKAKAREAIVEQEADLAYALKKSDEWPIVIARAFGTDGPPEGFKVSLWQQPRTELRWGTGPAGGHPGWSGRIVGPGA